MASNLFCFMPCKSRKMMPIYFFIKLLQKYKIYLIKKILKFVIQSMYPIVSISNSIVVNFIKQILAKILQLLFKFSVTLYNVRLLER